MLRYLGLFERGGGDRARGLRDAGIGHAHRRRGRLRHAARPPPTTPTRSSATSASKTETLDDPRGHSRCSSRCSRPDPDYVKVELARGRGPRRVRGVAAVGRGAGRLAHRARHRHAAGAEDDLEPRHEGVPAHRRDHRHARPLAVPVHHPGGPGRPARTRTCTSCWRASAAATPGCTSRSCRSSTASSGSPATRARTSACSTAGRHPPADDGGGV